MSWLAALVVLALVAPAAARSDTRRVRIVERVTVDASRHDLPLVRTSASVSVRADDATVRPLQTKTRTSDEYAIALRQFMSGFGAFETGEFAFTDSSLATTPRPRPYVRDGRARIALWTDRPVGGRADDAYYGHWRLSSHGRWIDLALPLQPSPLPTTVVVLLTLRGARTAASSEVPTESSPNRLKWVFRSDRASLTPFSVRLKVEGTGATYLAVDQRWELFPLFYGLSAAFLFVGLLLISAAHPWRWGFVSVAICMVAGGLVAASIALDGGIWSRFFMIAATALVPGCLAAASLSRRKAAAGTKERVVWVALLGMLVATATTEAWLIYSARQAVDWAPAGILADRLQVGLPLGAFLFIGAATLSGTRAWLWCVALLAPAAALALTSSWYWRTRPGSLSPLAAALISGGLVVLLLVVGVAALIRLMLALLPPLAPDLKRHTVRLWTAVALAITALAGAWIAFRWVNFGRLDRQTHLYRVLDVGTFASSLQADSFVYPVGLGTRLLDFMCLIGLAAVAEYLRGQVNPGVLPDTRSRRLIILIFGVFVGGSVGTAFYVRVPIVAAIGIFALWWLLRFGRSEETQPMSDATRRAMLTAPREKHPVKGTPAWRAPGLRTGFLADASDRTKRKPRPVDALEYGPYGDWWRNGRAAMLVSAPWAVVPALHYTYALFSQRYHALEPGETPFGLLLVSERLLFEYAYWLVASFVLGALYYALPGRTGVAKGLFLSLPFVVAQAVGEALPGRFDVLSLPFRAAEAAGFLALVGLLVDRLTLREANQGWAQLRERYDAGQWQVRLRYVAVVLPVVLLLSQQLIWGRPARRSRASCRRRRPCRRSRDPAPDADITKR